MGVQVEKARCQGEARQFENLLPRVGPEIGSNFLDNVA
jgi:hypothetical protein